MCTVGIETSKSDHNIIETKLNIEWSIKEAKVVEVFKFKDLEAKKKFKEDTKTNELSKIIDLKKPLNIVVKKFTKRLKGFIHKIF